MANQPCQAVLTRTRCASSKIGVAEISLLCGAQAHRAQPSAVQQATLDDHSEVVPPLPIPNRTVKHLSADDSGCTSVKVGHRQALIPQTPKCHKHLGVCLCALSMSALLADEAAGVSREVDMRDSRGN